MAETKQTIMTTLISGGVLTAALGGGLGFYQTVQQKEQELQTNLILELVKFDSNANKNTVNLARTIKELGLIERMGIPEERWQHYTTSNYDSLPRFYHSGFVWSVFYPHVREIKKAYRALGYYKADYDPDAAGGSEVDGAFVLATLRFQYDVCESQDLIAKRRAAGKTYVTCADHVDGIFGKGTLLELAQELYRKTKTCLAITEDAWCPEPQAAGAAD